MLNGQGRLINYLLALLVLFVLFFLQFLNLLNLNGLRSFSNWWKGQNYLLLQKLTQPIWRIQNMWQLSARLEDLQYRYSEAAAIVSQLQTLQQENRELRQMLENTDRSYNQVVISAPVISFAQTLVAVGSDRGIQPGSAVLHQGTLLGLIDQVDDRQSSVVLLAQLRERALVVRTSQGVQGLLRGNGREILLTEIPSDAPLSEGDLVFTETAPGVKAGFLVGRLAKVNRDNQAFATQTAVVEQLVNFFEVALVEVQ